jgi:FKBP-type peptidyl-prolyl cis-trans isomerase FklB
MSLEINRWSRVFAAVATWALLLAGESACWAQGGAPGAAPGQVAAPAAPADEATYRQQVGYMLGMNVGRDLKQNQIQCDLQSFMAGVNDALSGAQPKWSEQQLAACHARFETEMRGKMEAAMNSAGDKNKKEEAAFLAQNAKAEGVQTTPTGLQFKVLKQGTGATPALTDTVVCHYKGTLLDGTEFDSSYGRGEPASFPVNRVIPGWTEALQKMKVGDKWQLFVPAELAYRDEPPGPPIEPNSMLVFEVELLGVEGK